MKALPRLAVSMFARSFFVQASWNFQRMQNLGFFFLVYPALAQRHGRGSPELVQASLRHLELFNTHPYFAGLVAGTVARVEQGGEGDLAAALKRSLMCALGSIGDEFFWAHLRPLAALLALPFAIAGVSWAPLVMLAAFNAPHLALRSWGVAAGLSRGPGIVEFLQAKPLARAIPLAGAALALLAGGIVGAIATRGSWALLTGGGAPAAGVTAAVFIALVALQARGVPLGRILVAASLLAVLAGAARVVAAS